ncbi:unnamed protein product [Protopolystoma xenopodis]|uniref:Uncharacterized protein n=1 Tax=Protopolystoma xenopodis TaxID=117903 RepID=A0A448WV43_9PLAT|nr:unnamed protein product [Protopolystoma xenopodis]
MYSSYFVYDVLVTVAQRKPQARLLGPGRITTSHALLTQIPSKGLAVQATAQALEESATSPSLPQGSVCGSGVTVCTQQTLSSLRSDETLSAMPLRHEYGPSSLGWVSQGC